MLEGVLLGLLGRPRSGYDIATEFRRGARHVWAADQSQIYRTLARLEDEGLVTSRVEPSDRGPAKRTYRRTPAGRQALLRFLASEPQLPPERFPYLAQLFFMGEARDPDQTLRFLTAVKALFAERLACLEEIEDSIAKDGDEGLHAYMTLRLGLLAHRARLAWCDESIRRVRQHAQEKAR